jgi:hypothetical protein
MIISSISLREIELIEAVSQDFPKGKLDSGLTQLRSMASGGAAPQPLRMNQISLREI